MRFKEVSAKAYKKLLGERGFRAILSYYIRRTLTLLRHMDMSVKGSGRFTRFTTGTYLS